MAKSNLERRIDESAKKFEKSAEDFADRAESRFKDWIKNDRIFDGFRNTYARILLVVLATGWLVIGMLLTFNNESGFWFYAIGVLASVVAQQLSVRFVFNSEGREIVDEYQEARRNRAYRRAYRWVTGIVTGLVMLILFYSYATIFVTDGYLPLIPPAFIDVRIDGYQVAVVLVFLMGLFSLMPYFAWGFKGEPFRSRHEPNK